jgi:hypothetical protein
VSQVRGQTLDMAWRARIRKTDPMLVVRLTTVPSQGEADVICSMLTSEGIRCNERIANSVETLGNWREIFVAEADLARARELLARDD